MNKDAVAEMSQQYQVEAAEKLVPEGYKQTEVGVIPEDWETIELGDLLSYEQPTRYLVDSSDYLETGTVPVLTAGKTFVLGYTSEYDNLYTSLPVIIFDDFTTASKYVDFPFKAKSSAMKMLRPRNEQTPLQLVYSALNNIDFIVGDHKRHWISEFSKLKIAWPALAEEQAAIANALSDTDALLSELEKLIAKKQAIKTATMQQLLTGRTRLPQFAHHPNGSKKGYKQSELGEIPEDWGICNLSDFVLTLESGVSVNSIEQSDAFSHGKHVLKTSCVEKGYFYGNEKKSILPNDLKRAKCTPKAGCIIVSRMNTPSLVGEIGYVEKDCSSSFLPDRLWQIIFKKDVEVNTRWLAYFLIFPDISGKIKEAATGTSGSMKNISKGSFLSLALSTPNLEEQTAIATILSDMDAEIQALEQRLNKTRQIKQGMMQQLLTGKIRLEKPINEEPEHD